MLKSLGQAWHKKILLQSVDAKFFIYSPLGDKQLIIFQHVMTFYSLDFMGGE